MSEILSVCLSCANDKNTFNIFDTYECEGCEEIYAEMLKSCFNILITDNDELNAMCEKCILKLRDAFYFKQATLKNINDLKSQIELEMKLLEDLQSNYTENDDSLQDYKEPELDPKTGLLNYTNINNSKQEKVSVIITAETTVTKNEKNVKKSHDNSKMDYSKGTEKKDKPYTIFPGQTTCSICSESFTTTKTLHEHMNGHYPLFECDECGNKYASEAQLKRHKEVHLQGPFSCTQCDQVFEKLNTRNAHIWRVHQSSHPYICSECGERFKTFHQRLKHLQEFHGKTEPKYPCPHCSNKYFYSGSRSQHIRLTHLRERNYKCTHCNMAFGKRRALLSHLATKHGIGEKKNQCQLCDKSFYRSTTLRYHMKTHVQRDRNRYVCYICGLRFSYKSLLMNHQKSHENESAEVISESIIIDPTLEGSNDTVYFEITEG